MQLVMKYLALIGCVLFSFAVKAQKVEEIYFNLYTDSLKKGVHNYINVDGKLSNGNYYPLTAAEVEFSSSAGKWEGNSLVIDSCYKKDSVVITASLKDRPEVKKSVTIYMKKILVEPELKTQEQLLEEWKQKPKKSKG
jgi:hypothetical protein